MKEDKFNKRLNQTAHYLGRSNKTILDQQVSYMLGINQASVIKNADKIKLSDLLEMKLEEESCLVNWDMWRDLQIVNEKTNLD